ncbi:hypothetical protein L596_004440 [Steinernema carpocapsae]|uniref:Secreted protein n=1 Tax=Steinernema carpocapsae TaxID=34508 RepID=A0A4U8UZX7_STECR|nr:hypothetical protein L596_004440 [Steinernema carpocapsae]
MRVKPSSSPSVLSFLLAPPVVASAHLSGIFSTLVECTKAQKMVDVKSGDKNGDVSFFSLLVSTRSYRHGDRLTQSKSGQMKNSRLEQYILSI